MGPVFGYMMEAVLPSIFDKVHDPIYDKIFPAKKRRQSNSQYPVESQRSLPPPALDGNYEEDRRPRRSSRHDRRESQQRGRPQSPPTMVRRLTEKHFDNTDRGMTRGAVGAVAGGLLGHALGKSGLATAAGAALGGLGANAYDHRSDNSRRRESRGHERTSSSRRPRSRDRDNYSRSRVSGSRDSARQSRDGYESDRYSRRSSRYEPSKHVEFDEGRRSRASSRYAPRASDVSDHRYGRRASVPEPQQQHSDLQQYGLVPARRFSHADQRRYEPDRQPDRRATVEDSFSDASNQPHHYQPRPWK